jgi:hypothetical protein
MFNSILFKNIEEMLFDYFSNYKKVIVPIVGQLNMTNILTYLRRV